MGAIFGWLGREQSPRLQAVQQRLLHRGSRMHRAEVSSGCALIKFASARDCDNASRGGVTLALDGKIYSVEQSLPSASRSDARWLLDIYLELGVRAFDLVNGDYAVAIWDDRDSKLLLARDFCGAQPLFFTRLTGGSLLFASEYKALLLEPECDLTVDRHMIQLLQARKHLLSDRTLFKSIRAVAPGTVMSFAANGQSHVAHALQQPSGIVRPGSVADVEKRVADSFLSSMRLRVDNDRSIGVALSGGIDSIGVAFACRKFRPDRPLLTFTAGRDAQDPEIRTAAIVSERLGAIHHPVYVAHNQLAERLPAVVWHLENPIARTETVQFYEIGLAAQGKVDTLISGVGADGLFAGMPRHKLIWLSRFAPPPLRTALLEFYARTQSGRPPQTALGRLADYAYFRGKLPPVPTVPEVAFQEPLPAVPALSNEFLNDFLRDGFQESLAQWLSKLERTLGAYSVSFSSPFLDRSMIETAFSVPSDLKIRRGKEKFILRRALRSLVGEELVNVPKFPMRMAYDEEFADQLDALAERYLQPEQVRARGLLDPDSIKNLRRYRIKGRYQDEAAMRIWTAVMTEIWAQLFVDRRGEPIENG